MTATASVTHRSVRHHLQSTPATVRWGSLPLGGDAPALTIDPGDTVVIDTVSHEGLLEDQGADPEAFFASFGVDAAELLPDALAIAASDLRHDPQRQGPHVVTGPIHVRGAEPGDVLKITVVALEPRCDYGIVSNRHGRGALPGELPRGESTSSVFCRADWDESLGTMPDRDGHSPVRFPLRPFLGIMGVAPAGTERPSSIPPGRHGGNIDLSELVVGSVLRLPVQVAGALAYVGDPHFAQGDGEVALTAFEAPLTATLRFELERGEGAGAEWRQWPRAETDDHIVILGLDRDLTEAMRVCVRNALGYLQEVHGIDEERALAYLSAACDFSLTQVVDQVQGVHVRIRKRDMVGSGRV